MKNKYPVVFFVFKRPALTRKFLDIMVDSGVTKIYVRADGPRDSGEKVITDAVREVVDQFANEHPTVKIITSYAPNNLGLKHNIVNGLNEVFAVEDATIIIEDDCLPTRDFFKFTSELLNKYKGDARVMSVNGTSTGGVFHYSYGFTKYSQCWGWATWKRSWNLYDPSLTDFNPESWSLLADKLKLGRLLKWYWLTMLTLVKNGWIKTWDYQWSYAHFKNAGLAIAPSCNLIQNIGFDAVATNTKTKSSVANLSTAKLVFPLSHPLKVQESLSISRRIEHSFYANPIAILGLLRQYIYWIWSKYVNRH